jgi:hypothetical protein
LTWRNTRAAGIYNFTPLLYTASGPESRSRSDLPRHDNRTQLLHTLDPFPFRERDLDREAEEYIVGWARELATDQLVKIAVHFPETETQTMAARELTEAFRRYFSERAGIIQRDLKELFRVGRRPLGIGVSILIACLVSAHFAGGYFD